MKYQIVYNPYGCSSDFWLLESFAGYSSREDAARAIDKLPNPRDDVRYAVQSFDGEKYGEVSHIR